MGSMTLFDYYRFQFSKRKPQILIQVDFNPPAPKYLFSKSDQGENKRCPLRGAALDKLRFEDNRRIWRLKINLTFFTKFRSELLFFSFI